jgi:hypothetical protein
LLVVGTSNALVLYNESVKSCLQQETTTHTPVNIVEFKIKLVEDLVGRSIDNLFDSEGGGGEQHTPVRIEGGQRSWCAYCALISRTRRTRIQCAGCDVPLCSIGNGRVGDDCFTLAHENKDRREMVCRKYDEITR